MIACGKGGWVAWSQTHGLIAMFGGHKQDSENGVDRSSRSTLLGDRPLQALWLFFCTEGSAPLEAPAASYIFLKLSTGAGVELWDRGSPQNLLSSGCCYLPLFASPAGPSPAYPSVWPGPCGSQTLPAGPHRIRREIQWKHITHSEVRWGCWGNQILTSQERLSLSRLGPWIASFWGVATRQL